MARYVYCMASVDGFCVVFFVNLALSLVILVPLVVCTSSRDGQMDSNQQNQWDRSSTQWRRYCRKNPEDKAMLVKGKGTGYQFKRVEKEYKDQEDYEEQIINNTHFNQLIIVNFSIFDSIAQQTYRSNEEYVCQNSYNPKWDIP